MMFRQIAIALICLTVCSCAGYKLGNTKPISYKQIKSLAIPQFKNETLYPKLSALASNATLDAFVQDGSYAIRSHPDAELLGTIKKIEYKQFRANRFDTLASDELKVIVHLDWKLVQNGNIIGKGNAAGTSTFNVDGNLSIARQNALPLAVSRASQQIVSQLSIGF